MTAQPELPIQDPKMDKIVQSAPAAPPTEVPVQDGSTTADAPPPPPQAPSTALAAPVPQVVIPFHPTDVQQMFRLAKFLADSNLVPRDLQRRPNDVLVVLLKGHDLGLTPMQSISGINVIDGKAEVGATMMVSMILKSPFCEFWEPIFAECDATRATYETKRRGARGVSRFVYTIDDAKAAGLLDRGKNPSRSPWQTQRPTMLRRRCQSSLAREIYPDICAGLYDHDELRELRELELGIIRAEITAQRDASSNVVPDWMAGGIIPAEGVEVATASPPTTGDPLKDRLRARAAQRDPNGPPDVQSYPCAGCGAPVVATPGDRCEACKQS